MSDKELRQLQARNAAALAEAVERQREADFARANAESRRIRRLRGEVIPITAQFDAEAVAFIHERGSNKVMGSAYLRQQGGGVVTCAGHTVWLVPHSEHSHERVRKMYPKVEERETAYLEALGEVYGEPAYGKRLPREVPEYYATTRQTPCDAQGRFEFEQVADGRYYLTTEVLWWVGGNAQGGQLMAPVMVTGGETAKVVLTKTRP